MTYFFPYAQAQFELYQLVTEELSEIEEAVLEKVL